MMISKIYYSIVAFLIIATLVACELFTEGYGDKVDLSNPEITIDSPVNGEYVSGTFILKGTATDDTSVSSVVVEYISNVTGSTVSKNATYSESNWSISINTSDSTIFDDGEVEFDVTVKDSASKTSSKNRIVYIDNTIPTVVVSSPVSDELDIINGDLTISGEVDDLKLDKVDVYLISTSDDTIKIGGTADGTSSWSYNIDTISENLGIDNVESYYLDITAYDVAGNSNTYFYYNDDLSSVKTDLGVTSVTMDVLTNESNATILSAVQRNVGDNQLVMYIDQDEDTPNFLDFDEWDYENVDNYSAFTDDVYLNGRITDDDGLESVVISIYNSDDELIRQGTADANDSRSFSVDLALEAATWTGYTMTSGLFTDYLSEGLYSFSITANDIEGSDSGTVTFTNKANFGIDKTDPKISITSPSADDAFNGAFTVSGTVYDTVNIEKVEVVVGSRSAALATLGDDKTTWSYTVDISGLSGDTNITATVSDGNGHTEYKTIKVYIDGTIPVLDPTTIKYYNVQTEAVTTDINGTITVKGKATDNLLDHVTYNVGGKTGNATLDGSTWSFDIDTTQFYTADSSASVDVSLQVWAYDGSGNKSIDLVSPYNILTVEESSDIPVITFKTPDEVKDSNSYSGSITIWAELTDDDAINEDTIVLKVDDIEIAKENYIREVVAGSVTVKYSPTFDDDGDHKVLISISDKKDIGIIKNESKEIDFVIDSHGPKVTNIKVDGAEILGLLYKKSDFTITGDATDLKDVAKIIVTATFDEEEAIEYEIPYIGVTPSVSWTKTIPLLGNVDAGDEKPLTLTIEAIDSAGNSSGVINKNLIIDRISPVLDIELSSNTTDLNTVETLYGGAADDHLSSVKVAYIDKVSGKTTWLDTTGTPYSWKYDLDTTKINDGDSIFYVQAIDDAGNVVEKEYSINVNQTADLPLIEINNIVGLSTTSTISGTVTDDDGVYVDTADSIQVILYELDGVTEVKTINATIVGSGKRVEWSAVLDDITAPTLPQGQYKLKVDAKDITTPTAISSNFSLVDIILDNGAPELTEIVIDGLSYINETFQLSGVASDGFKVSTVTASYTINDVNEVIEAGEFVVSGDENDNSRMWILTVPVNTDTHANDGEYIFTIKAQDPAAVSAGTFTKVTRNIIVDSTKPELELNFQDKLILNESVEKFTATASDANGIKGVNIYVKKDNGVDDAIKEQLPVSGSYSNWSLVNDINLSTYAGDTNYVTDVKDSLTDGVLIVANLPTIGTIDTYYRVTSESDKMYLFNGAEFLPVTNIWALKVYYTAEDKSGLISDEAFKTIYIDSASDLPVLKVDNLTVVPGDTLTYFPSQRISGTVLDDDGVKSSEIKIGIANLSDTITDPETDLTWVDVTSSVSGTDATWSYLIPNSEKGVTGDKKLWIKAEDINSVSHTLIEPITFTIDRQSPQSTLFTIEGDNSNVGYSSKSADKITIKAKASDDYGIDTNSLYITFKDKDENNSNYPLFYNSVTDEYLLASDAIKTEIKGLLGEGTTTFTLYGNDKFLKTFTAVSSIYSDSTVPTVKINNSSLNPIEINQEFSIDGIISESESGVGSVNISLGKDIITATPNFSGTSWSLTDYDVSDLADEDDSTNIIDTLDFEETKASVDLFIKTDIGYYKTTSPEAYYYYNGAEYLPITEVWEFDAVVSVTDKAGNVSVSKTQTFNINDALDIPVLSLDNLTKDSVAQKYVFPGQLIKGTISDDDGVDASTIIIAITDPGDDPVDDDWVELGLTSDGSPIQWSHEIPSAENLSAASNTADGFLGVRDLHIKAKDLNGNHLDHIRIESFVIDRAAPVISGFATTKSIINKENESTNSGTLTLSAIVTDDSEIDEVQLSYKDKDGTTVTPVPTPSGTFSETITIDTLAEGSTTFTLTATDQFGKITTEQLEISKDTILPVVGFISPEVRVDINGIIDIKGSTSDANIENIKIYYNDKANDDDGDGGAVTLTADDYALIDSFNLIGTTNGTNLNNFVTGSTLYGWTYKLDTSGVASTGFIDIKIVATDSNGNESETVDSTISLTINQDKDTPTISEVNSNKIIPNADTATNAYTVVLDHTDSNNVLFGYSPAGTIGILVNDGVTDRIPVTLVNDTSGVYWYADLSDYGDPTSNSVGVDLIIKPLNTLHYIGLRDSNVATNSIAKHFSTNDKLTGTFEDDDKIDVDNSSLTINGVGKTLTIGSDSSRVSWSYDGFTSDPSGLYIADIIAKDTKLYKGTGYGTVATSEEFKSFIVKDTGSPEIDAKLNKTSSFLEADDIDHQGAYVNGTVIAYGSATDDLSIKNFTITAKKSTGSVEISTNSTYIDLPNDTDENKLTNSNLGNSSVFDVKSTEFTSTSDNKTWSWEFALERLPDAYEGNSISLIYEATDVIGNVTTVEKSITVDTTKPTIDIIYPTQDSTVTGYVTIKGTTDDASLDKVYMTLGTNGSEILLPGTYSWEYEIYSLASEYLDGSTYHADSNLSDNIDDEYYVFPVTIRAVDKAGNEQIKDTYSFKISSNLDNPIVNVSSPSSASTLGGTVQFIGTAEDNTGVDSVWARIDIDGDGLYTHTIDLNDDDDTDDVFEKETEWYPVDNFSNNIWRLEINKTGELYNRDTTNSSDDIDKINIQFKALDDKTIPAAGFSSEIELFLDDSFPLISNFKTNVDSLDVRDEFKLTATLQDTGGFIEKVEISYDGGKTYEPVAKDIHSETYTMMTNLITPTDLGLVDKSGVVDVRLKVTDDTPYISFSSLQLNVDNVLPVGLYTGNINDIGILSTDTTTTTKPVTISGKFSDTGSGFGGVSSFNRVEVYLTQDGNIINPLTGASEVAGTLNVNGVDIVYPILDSPYDPDDPDDPDDTVHVAFDNLIVIDHLGEYGSLDLDGDGYKEYVTLSSGEYVWSTEFDSVNIDIDTPIELNYIVYDDAGNANYYSEIMIMVGFEIDEIDGTVDDDEKIAYPVGFSALANYFYVGVYGGTSAGYYIKLLDGATTLGTSDLNTTQLTVNTGSTGFNYSEGLNTFNMELYKYVDGGDDILKLTKDLSINFKSDSEPSVITINPLNQGSIQDVSGEAQGHLEMNATGNYDISGTVRFYGTVTDDTRIKDISVTVGVENESDTNVVDVTTVLTEWVDGIFTGKNGLVITNQTQHWENGHSVSFYYDWDSSTISENPSKIARDNVGIKFTSRDYVGSHDVLTSSNQLTYDVIPYISDITTGLEDGTKSFLKRSASGAYTINNTDGNIIINGFNLNAQIDIGNTTHTGAPLVAGSSITLAKSSILVSGSISVTTNSIESRNNDNDDVESNKEPSLYNPNQTDDRKIHVWDINTTTYAGMSEAVMVPYLNTSGVKTGAMDWMYVENSKSVKINSNELSDSWALKGGSFAYNDSGTPMYIFLHNMNTNSASPHYAYFGSVQWGKGLDDEAQSVNWHRTKQDRLALGNLSFNSDSNYGYTEAIMDRYQNLKIDVTGYDAITNNLVTYFDKASESRSIVFWSFNVGNGGTITKTTQMDGSWYADITKNGLGADSNYNVEDSYKGLQTPLGRVELTSGGEDSEHFDMNYDKNRSNVVIAYYDEVHSKLKIKYNNDPVVTPSTWVDATFGVDDFVDEGAGQHVSMITDASGKLHLAYYDASGSYLKYVLVTPKYDVSKNITALTKTTPIIVDALFTNGMYNSISLKDFGGGYTIPVISTYSIAYGGTKNSIRVSWPIKDSAGDLFDAATVLTDITAGAEQSSGAYTGAWEVVAVCSDVAPSQDKTFINTNTAGNTGEIIVGYNGTKIEEATLLEFTN